MATVLGAGTALATAWLLDPVSTVRARVEERVGEEVAEPAALTVTTPSGPPSEAELAIALLSRIIALLASAPSGLPLSGLRATLTEPTDAIQRALVAGIRTKQLRRVGAHNKLRYVRNT
jgi:hypothetical protein